MKITHNIVFLFGFTYYLVVPMLIANSLYLDGYPAIDGWKNNFNENFITRYYIIILFIFISFYLGSFFALIIRKKGYNQSNEKEYYYSFSILYYLLFLLTVYTVVTNLDSFFVGYSNYNISLLGQLGTINIVLTMIFIYRKIFNYQYKIGSSNKILVGLIIFISFLLLGNGSRMSVLFSILSIIIFNINYNFLSIRKASVVLLLVLVIFLTIAHIRIGGNFDPDMFAYFFFAEPIFTSYSTVSYLGANSNLEAFNLPLNYLSSFLNFIPSAIIPNKGDYIINMNELVDYTSPLGADSIFVSLMVNFGYIGSFIFIFILGFTLTTLSKQKTIFLKVYYICLLAIMPFQFFRDNFAILNKVILYNILFLPILYFMFIKLLRKKKNENCL